MRCCGKRSRAMDARWKAVEVEEIVLGGFEGGHPWGQVGNDRNM